MSLDHDELNLTNHHTFMMSSDEGLLRGAGAVRYHHHTEAAEDQPPRDYLDLTKLTLTPTPCAKYADMMEHYANHPMPFCLLKCDWAAKKQAELARDMSEADAKELVARMKHNPFHYSSPSYIQLTFSALVKLFQQLPPEDRNLATSILPNLPLHYYADIDGNEEWCLVDGAVGRNQPTRPCQLFGSAIFGVRPVGGRAKVGVTELGLVTPKMFLDSSYPIATHEFGVACRPPMP
jgi:hypothetical protein